MDLAFRVLRNLNRWLRRAKGNVWVRVFWLGNRIVYIWRKLGLAGHLAIVFILAASSLLLTPSAPNPIDETLATPEAQNVLENLVLTIGGSLLGATAIAFSLILFALQTNVQRLPYGLFRRSGADWRLIATFVTTWVISFLVAASALVVTATPPSHTLLICFWSVVTVLILLLYSYRRALDLINPISQLDFILRDTRKSLSRWQRRFRRVRALYEPAERQQSGHSRPSHDRHDLAWTSFQIAHPEWISSISRGLRYCISLHRHNVATGDYGPANAALRTVVYLNETFVQIKGLTFYASPLPGFFETPLQNESFITETLEELRRNADLARNSSDEQQLIQTYSTITQLSRVYSEIDYASQGRDAPHYNLAVTHLVQQVEADLPSANADILLSGVGHIEQAVHVALQSYRLTDARPTVEKVGVIGLVCTTKQSLHPVVSGTVDSLSRVMVAALHVDTDTVESEMFYEDAWRATSELVQAFVRTQDEGFMRHAMYLSGIFGLGDSFDRSIVNRANAVLEAEDASRGASVLAENILHCCKASTGHVREILRASLQQRSSLSDRVIWFLHDLTLALTALSGAQAIEGDLAGALRKQAIQYIRIFDVASEDPVMVATSASSDITERLITIGYDALHRGQSDISGAADDTLRHWALLGSRHDPGWAILERALVAICALAVARGDSKSDMDEFTDMLRREFGGAEAWRLVRAADELREAYVDTAGRRYRLSRIDSVLESIDDEEFRQIASYVADRLDAERT